MKRFPSVLTVILLSACATAPKRGIPIPIPPPPRPIAELLDQLNASDSGSRAAAAWSWGGAGKVEADAVQALRAALDDPTVAVREAASWALGHVEGPGLEVAELFDSGPKPLVMTRPKYPNDAFRRKIAGTVELDILIGESGKVVHAEVRKSIPGLDDAALACVREWQFEPAKRKGKPMATTAQAPVSFRIH